MPLADFAAASKKKEAAFPYGSMKAQWMTRLQDPGSWISSDHFIQCPNLSVSLNRNRCCSTSSLTFQTAEVHINCFGPSLRCQKSGVAACRLPRRARHERWHLSNQSFRRQRFNAGVDTWPSPPRHVRARLGMAPGVSILPTPWKRAHATPWKASRSVFYSPMMSYGLSMLRGYSSHRIWLSPG